MGRAYPRTWERLRIGTVPVPAYGADIYGVPSKADRLNALWTVNRAARFHGLLAPCFHGPFSTWSIYHCPQAKNGCEAS